MKLISWSDFVEGALGDRPMAATVGVFDGIHRGHRKLISRILSTDGLQSVVFTFRDNPKRSLRPGTFHGNLFTHEQKLEELERLGVEVCVQIDFSGDFSKLAGRIFLSLLIEKGGIRLLVVGSDFRCGHRLDTDVQDIRSYYEPLGIRTEVLEPVLWDGHPISSSRIRKAVAEGRLDSAAAMLGRPFALDLRGAVFRPESGGPGFELVSGQALPPAGRYEVLVSGCGFELETYAFFDGRLWILEAAEKRECEAVRLLSLVSRV